MCGCHPSVYQELREFVTNKIEGRFFRGRHIFPRGIWAIREVGKFENAYRHGTLLKSWTKPCDCPDEGERIPSGIANLFGKFKDIGVEPGGR